MQHENRQLLGSFTQLTTKLITKYYISIKIQITHPTSLNKRISTLSSNETIINESKEIIRKSSRKIRLSANFKVSPCKRKCQQ